MNQAERDRMQAELMKHGELKATPARNKPAAEAGKALHKAHEFVAKPFGYNNPPAAMISEMLGVPALARTLERLGYGEPLTTGSGMTTKPRADTMDAMMAVAPLAPMTKGRPVGAAIKDVGGNWLKGSVEDSLKRLKSQRPTHRDEALMLGGRWAQEADTPEGVKAMAETSALNSWIDRNLTNYVKKEMATPNDPIRKLAEEGITHLPEGTPMPRNMSSVWASREDAGFPAAMGTSREAQVWEAMSDKPVGFGTAGEMINTGRGEPWMEKVDPFTRVHGIAPMESSNMTRDLGFDHIVDVLRQDLEAGRIRPEQLSKVSIEQAVRRTHHFDQEMAKKMAEAQIKATEGMPTHKEYPEGYKWIELAPGKELPEGWTTKNNAYYDPQGVRRVHPDAEKVSNALKYEGDTMGHCVGGYCPDVLEGRSRIFSLRDSKGEPHVTIEVAPDIRPRESYFGEPQDEIVQIKGKQNKAPKDEYLPYVQDFVKGGNWHAVGDLQNAGLQRGADLLNDTLNPLFNRAREIVLEQRPGLSVSKDEMRKMLEGKYYASPEEVASDILGALPAPPTPPQPFWANLQTGQVAPFEASGMHNAVIQDPKYAEALGVTPETAFNPENPLIMGRLDPKNQEVLNLMQTGAFTAEQLPALQQLLLSHQVPHQRVSLSAGENLFENIPREELLKMQALEDLGGYKKYAGGGKVTKEVSTPWLMSVPGYSESVAYEMYPGQKGQDDQQDAARHMLASGTLARKYGAGPAAFLGKAHEYVHSPLQALKTLFGGQMPPDFDMDVHNNALGVELGTQAKDQSDLERLVQEMAEKASKTRTTGLPFIKKATGGSVGMPSDFTTPDMADGGRFFPDPDFMSLALSQSR